MSVSGVLHVLGRLCLVFAGVLLLPLLAVAADGGAASGLARAFLLAAGVALLLGLLLVLAFRIHPAEFDAEEAFAVTTFSWLLFTGLGALPYVLSGAIPDVIDASFETLSGLTTTGATVLTDPAALGRPLLVWRALTQWVGGMGIVALSLAVLPALGAGGNHLYWAEATGPFDHKLMPRIRDAARLLWTLYLGLTVAAFVGLLLAGMSGFDALCHAFATVSTGGFGTRADSLTSFPAAVQWVCVGFMLLSGLNLVLLLRAVSGRPGGLFASAEVRAWLAVLLVASAVSVGVLSLRNGGVDEPLVRDAVFTVVSIGSTSGFATADYGLWPVALHVVLLLLMVTGACTGSTSGSAKVFRHLMWARAAWRELQRLLRPDGVFVVRIDGRPVPDAVVARSVSFLLFFLGAASFGTLLLALLGLDGAEALSSAVSCLGGVGPALGDTGPKGTFAPVPPPGKLLLMLFMLLGRLEYFAVLVLFSPLAWRR